MESKELDGRSTCNPRYEVRVGGQLTEVLSKTAIARAQQARDRPQIVSGGGRTAAMAVLTMVRFDYDLSQRAAAG